MVTIEQAVIEYLISNHENEVKHLVEKIYNMVNGKLELLYSYLGDGLRFLLMDEFSGENVQDKLMRLGLANVDWVEVAEEIYNKEVV